MRNSDEKPTMSNQWSTKNGRTSKRGLFVNGIWHCDCETRLPAEKFQVKNGGKNHGRWFYTCQRPQTKRCSFFLWSDDAKVREEAAVLSNSRTEPDGQGQVKLGEGAKLRSDMETPQTPKRQTKITEPITPVSKTKSFSPDLDRSEQLVSSPTEAKNDEFDWSSSADEELAEFADSLKASTIEREEAEGPRKIARTSNISSPGKRTLSETKNYYVHENTSSGTLPISEADIFRTPSIFANPSEKIGLLSPGKSPTHPRRQLFASQQAQDQPYPKDQSPQEELSGLAIEALNILTPIRSSLPQNVEQKLTSLLNKHDTKMQGVSRGRDIARIAVQNKEKRITELLQRIASLEAEKETQRTVIQHLKTDIATSPKKPRRPKEQMTRRS